MADEADRGSDREEEIKSDSIAKARRAAAAIPEGNPGECDGCGYWFSRLAEGYCGHCRDKYNRWIK